MTEYLVPAGQALYELIMGKLGAEYTAGKEKYDPLELLNMVEALIKINLNGNPVFVSLKDGYVYVSLSAVGGDNFKASLKNIIDQIKKTSGSGSSALATGEGDGEKDNKKTDYVLVNKILQNLLSSASISNTGLDLALAPDLMNVLLENVVAKLLGDTFGFNDDVKAMFTLSSPYAKLSDGKTSVDGVLYTEKSKNVSSVTMRRSSRNKAANSTSSTRKQKFTENFIKRTPLTRRSTSFIPAAKSRRCIIFWARANTSRLPRNRQRQPDS